jgi:hypothetical protein
MSVSYLVVQKRLENRKSSQQNQLPSQDLLTDPLTDLVVALSGWCLDGSSSQIKALQAFAKIVIIGSFVDHCIQRINSGVVRGVIKSHSAPT